MNLSATSVPTRLLLIRHAQSANNALADHLRVPDPGLTELGQRQAEELSKKMAGTFPHFLYCSPFQRSLETTAAITRQLKLVPRVIPDLCEQGGCYAGHLPRQKHPHPGMSRSEIAQRYPGWDLSQDINENGWWFASQFEDHAQTVARAKRVVDWLNSHVASLGGVHALVIHADFKMRLLEQMVELSYELATIEPYNTSVTRLDWQDGRWKLVSFNNVDHLADDLRT
jgi:2,3-bisphosphoglycerate-dependent phosphoglycerate mutase